MIIYGTRGKVLITEQVIEACPHCKTHNSLYISIVQRWAHVFWIPFFPIGKTGVSQCSNCKQVLKVKEMPAAIRMSYDNIKAQANTPVWAFSGIGVIAVVALAITLMNHQKGQKVTRMIPVLQKEDIIHLRLSDTTFTLAKVSRVKGDTVFLLYNKFVTNRFMEIGELKSKEFETQEERLSVADLKNMDNKGEVIDVERN